MKKKSIDLAMYRYITLYYDWNQVTGVCELVHFAPSLPAAIKVGRAYVRDLNRREHCRPGMKRYHYDSTFRAR